MTTPAIETVTCVCGHRDTDHVDYGVGQRLTETDTHDMCRSDGTFECSCRQYRPKGVNPR